MNDEIRLSAREIFADALELKDPAQRERYLAQACGQDSKVRQMVESLLAAHREAGEFMQPTKVVRPENPIGEGPGTVIGRYKLLQQIGEGGFGRVFMAEQLEPVQRKVALKIIKAGMDTREVIARFEVERQALALMDHPNIARVLDAGATESGRPYFVMELVKGIKITDYCDQNNLSTEERLGLFIKVCHAVQHAHQKGIIHRDLKPSNVMVTLHDGEAVPKVIDFGIAKATGQRLTDKTLFTRYEQMIGTPAYMSPEQAQMSGLDIDTRTDIYALGVLLYELLTGVTPFDKDTLARVAFDEIRKLIQEKEPPKPSTRLHTMGEKLTEVAKHRHTEPGVLRRSMRGDLDWIVMKSLEKDRRRRYETANDFAEDIQRHLKHQPVVASPPGTLYRAGKFIRRHRVGVAMAAAVSTALVLGLIASLIGFTRASRERERALAAERIAQKEASNAATTVNLVAKMLGAEDSAAASARGRDFTVRQMLDEFSIGLGDRLKDQPEVEGEVEQIIAAAYAGLNLGEPHQMHAEKALAARRRVYGDHHVKVAEAIFPLVSCYGGEKGVRLAGEAIHIYRALDPQSEGFVNALSIRAQWLTVLGRKDEARRDAQEAWAVAQKLSTPRRSALYFALVQLGRSATDLDEAEEWMRRALDLGETIYGSWHRRPALANRYLGEILNQKGDYAAAEPYLRRAFSFHCWAYGTNNSSTALCLAALRENLWKQGKSDPALDVLSFVDTLEQVNSPERASALYKLRVHTPGEYRLYLRWDSHDAESDSVFAQIVERQDGPGEAVADAYGFVIPVFPGDADFARLPPWQGEADLEELNESLADQPAVWNIPSGGDYTLRLVMSEDGAALDAFVLQLASLRAPEGNGPPESEITADGVFLEREGRVVAEAEHFTSRVEGKTARWLRVPQENEGHVSHLHYRGTGYLQALPDDTPDHPAELSRNRGFARAHAGEYAEAIGHYVRAVEAAPDIARWRYELAMAQWGAGDMHGHGATLQRMLEGLEKAGTNASSGLIPWTCALCPDAVQDYAPPLAIATRAVAADAAPGTRIRGLTTLGALLYRAKRYPEAIKRLTEAKALGQRVTSKPTDPSLACAMFFLAMAHQQVGHTDEARSCLQQALDWERNEFQLAQTDRPMPWPRRLTLDSLHRETQALLGKDVVR